MRLRNGTARIDLKDVRRDLALSLATYKLPTVLRILRDGEEIPRTVAGKPIKPGLMQRFFNVKDFLPANYAADGVECWRSTDEQLSHETRPWDWCGMQRND